MCAVHCPSHLQICGSCFMWGGIATPIILLHVYIFIVFVKLRGSLNITCINSWVICATMLFWGGSCHMHVYMFVVCMLAPGFLISPRRNGARCMARNAVWTVLKVTIKGDIGVLATESVDPPPPKRKRPDNC